jgi:hypothetical protein
MARGIFNPEGEFLRELHKRKLEEVENEPPETEEGHETESPEEKAAWEETMRKAEEQNKTRVGKKPVKIETAEQLAPYLESEFEKISAAHQAELAEKHSPGGLKSRRVSRGWERGHRHGLKKERAKGGETIREKKAA